MLNRASSLDDGTGPAAGLRRPSTGVTAAAGFTASALHCGIRRQRADLALLACDRPAAAAAVFTRNLVQAAPVLVSRRHLQRSQGRVRALVVNSGNANACTGEPGMAAARATTAALAGLLGAPGEQILVASTGVIGQPLPVQRILDALPAALDGLSVQGGAALSEAILTTDTCSKQAVRRVAEAASHYVVGGVAKGSGMIHPDMATTLGFVTTDADIEPGLLQEILTHATERSFNRITVDGDTSTNDMVAVLASGAAGVPVRREDTAAVARFREALTGVLVDLARAVARDGEGATRLVTVRVTSAAGEAEALQVARTVAGSPLVKTAVHGADANWGRIVAAAGRSGVAVDAAAMQVDLNGLTVLSPGYVSDFDEQAARERLLMDEVEIRLDLGQGHQEATVWTCDLSKEYITINASYRS